MNKPQDRTVSRRSDGTWANKRDDATRASSIHHTQSEAENTGKAMLAKQGGGELKVQGLDGRIRSKDTVPPGHDPNPPKDKEH
jgi:hypothetical protein